VANSLAAVEAACGRLQGNNSTVSWDVAAMPNSGERADPTLMFEDGGFPTALKPDRAGKA